MKKSGRPTYLNEDEESLLVASADIEGGNFLPLDWRGFIYINSLKEAQLRIVSKNSIKQDESKQNT